MLSPVYTPFSGPEVATALGLSSHGYHRAVSSGALERNVHFEEDARKATSMHSLVDVTRFVALRGMGWPRVDCRQFKHGIDCCLDAVCFLIEISEELTIPGDPIELSECMTYTIHPWEDFNERVFASLVARSWLYSHRMLTDILSTDRGKSVEAASERA